MGVSWGGVCVGVSLSISTLQGNRFLLSELELGMIY